MSPAVSAALPYLIVPLVLWRVYARIKRLVTRQRSVAWRHWLGLGLFGFVIAVMALVSLSRPLGLAALAAGVGAGAGLAVAALQRTRFELEDGVLHYTPHAHIGLAVSLVFIGRLCWRMLEVYQLHGAPQPPQNPGDSPLTMLTFGIMAGYYTLYAAGVLRWRRAHGVR